MYLLNPHEEGSIWFWFCLFVLGISSLFENFSLIWWCHHCRWRAANFNLCSAILAIAQCEFFNVPHLWHGPLLYNGHLWWLIAELWQWSCHYLFYDLFGTFTVPFVFGVKLYIEFFFVNAIWNKTTLSVLSILTVNGSCVVHEKWKILCIF